MKQSAEEVEDTTGLVAENEILRAKCSELESKVNTMSRGDEDQRREERRRYDMRILELNQDNLKQVEKAR